MPAPDLDGHLTRQQVADAAGIALGTVWQWTHTRGIPRVRHGHWVYYPAEQVHAAADADREARGEIPDAQPEEAQRLARLLRMTHRARIGAL